jgi:hypothetical protein
MWSFAEIFKPIRNFVAKIPYIRRPLLCPECSSFWMGFGVSFFYNPLILNVLNFTPFTNICGGLITHLIASVLYKYITSLSVNDKYSTDDKIYQY